MYKYAFNPDAKTSVRVYGRSLNISHKSSQILCGRITGMNLEKAKRLLENMVSGKHSLDGKYYTNASVQILSLLKSGESNAEAKGLDTSRLLVHASSHKGYMFMRPRRLKMRRTRKKITNVQVVLVQK
ncbi:MAG TPA: uL22 family ribosomal protein [archaeon]|jgi:ribosomal protein L22|nr:uL22 family ribosomal protein [archaeon]